MSTEQEGVDVPPHVVEYLSGQSTLTLATASSGGVPRASTFLYVNDGPKLFFWTKPHTTTAQHLEQNPVVSFAVDDYTDDLRQTKGVQGSGECSVVLSGEEIARVADLFGQKFPDLSPGATMSISFFRITPTEIEFIDNTGEGSATSGETFGAEFHRERSFSVFADLPVVSSDAISAVLQSMSADAGEVIVREGGPADKFFVVTEGEVEVTRGQGDQTETVATLGPGHFFGEVAIMRDTARSATITARSPTRLLAMERETFRDVVAQSLGTTAQFDQIIRGRLEALGG
ncbi:MAG: cyclic nucleotide-binding domain-containing protein [Solirubrobacterales bacterium]